MRLIGFALAVIVAVGCTGASVALPTFELPRIEVPSFDTSGLQRLVDDALTEVYRLGPTIENELPSDLAALLAEHNIEPPALPSNSNAICDGLGTPG
ncbi:MAG: hypothetical protein ACR2H0_00540 [Candidatus Limnocylindrales bacterium]